MASNKLQQGEVSIEFELHKKSVKRPNGLLVPKNFEENMSDFPSTLCLAHQIHFIPASLHSHISENRLTSIWARKKKSFEKISKYTVL